MQQLFIGVDNSIIIDGVRDSSTHQYVNDAVLSFTLYRPICEDGVATAGSTALTSATAGFVAGDVGKSVIVPGAGAQGSDLKTTISALVSATQVTLALAASVSVTYSRLKMSLPSAQNVSMHYVSGTNAKYRGTLDSAVKLTKGESYTLAVSVDAGSGREDLRQIEVGATYRS